MKTILHLSNLGSDRIDKELSIDEETGLMEVFDFNTGEWEEIGIFTSADCMILSSHFFRLAKRLEKLDKD